MHLVNHIIFCIFSVLEISKKEICLFWLLSNFLLLRCDVLCRGIQCLQCKFILLLFVLEIFLQCIELFLFLGYLWSSIAIVTYLFLLHFFLVYRKSHVFLLQIFNLLQILFHFWIYLRIAHQKLFIFLFQYVYLPFILCPHLFHLQLILSFCLLLQACPQAFLHACQQALIMFFLSFLDFLPYAADLNLTQNGTIQRFIVFHKFYLNSEFLNFLSIAFVLANFFEYQFDNGYIKGGA